jgi:hypothetical protein
MSANTITPAPTGRKKLAQGTERSDAALGHDSQHTPSPEGAKGGGEWPVVKSGDLFSFLTSGSRGWAKYYSESGPLFLRVGNLDHARTSPAHYPIRSSEKRLPISSLGNAWTARGVRPSESKPWRDGACMRQMAQNS